MKMISRGKTISTYFLGHTKDGQMDAEQVLT